MIRPGSGGEYRSLTLALAAALLAAVPAGAEEPPPPDPAPREEVGVFAWHQRLTGSVRGVRSARSGVGELQRDGDSSVGFLARLGRWNLGFTRLNHEAQGVAVLTLQFRGVTFAQNDHFRLSHRLSFLDAFHDFDLHQERERGLRLQLGFKVTKITTLLLNTRSQAIASIDETVPVPHVGLQLRLGQEQVAHGFVRFQFTELSHDDVDVRMADLSLGLQAPVGRRVWAALGWRSLELEVNVLKRPGREGGLDFRSAGPFLQLRRRF